MEDDDNKFVMVSHPEQVTQVAMDEETCYLATS